MHFKNHAFIDTFSKKKKYIQTYIIYEFPKISYIHKCIFKIKVQNFIDMFSQKSKKGKKGKCGESFVHGSLNSQACK